MSKSAIDVKNGPPLPLKHMPEDIPEDGCLPPMVDEPPERKGIKDYLNKFYTEEWLFALVSLGFTFGWSVSGFPPSIILACSCWVVTIAVLLHYFWVWSRKANIHRWISAGAINGFCLTIVLFSWKPVRTQYIAEHSPVPATPAEATIMETTGQIESALTNKPTVQLVAFTVRNPAEYISEVGLQRLVPGDNDVYLHKFSFLEIEFVISGKKAIGDIRFGLVTSWMRNGNITGGVGWTDWGGCAEPTAQPDTFLMVHDMEYVAKDLENPNTFIQLPMLYIPDNYTNNVLVTRWQIDSPNIDEENIKVTFHFNQETAPTTGTILRTD